MSISDLPHTIYDGRLDAVTSVQDGATVFHFINPVAHAWFRGVGSRNFNGTRVAAIQLVASQPDGTPLDPNATPADLVFITSRTDDAYTKLKAAVTGCVGGQEVWDNLGGAGGIDAILVQPTVDVDPAPAVEVPTVKVDWTADASHASGEAPGDVLVTVAQPTTPGAHLQLDEAAHKNRLLSAVDYLLADLRAAGINLEHWAVRDIKAVAHRL